METDEATVVVAGLGSGDEPGIGDHADEISQQPEPGRPGFSGTCQTTLTDWIQLVQMGRRDAVVSVRTHDGKEGTLWCRGGDIIDAACDGLAGEEAVYRALSWQGGQVSVEFEDFDHRRKIDTPTSGLLLGAAYRTDTAFHEHGEPGHLTEVTSGPLFAGLGDDEPTLESPQVVPLRRHPRLLRWLAGAGGLLPFMVLSVVAWRWASSDEPPRVSAGPQVASSFSVHVVADPPEATIRLDGQTVAAGRLETTLLRDGRTHEIVSAAPGYVSQRIAFRDAPPPARVVLAPSAVSDLESTVAEAQRARKLDLALAARAKAVLAHRHVAPPVRAKPVLATSPKTVSPTASERPRESAPTRVNVQIIEERRPGVQIIDDRPRSRTSVVE